MNRHNQQSSEDLVRQLFLEEQYMSVDRSDEDVAYIDYTPEALKTALDNIKDLIFIEQVAYVTRLPIILESLGKDGLKYIQIILAFVKEEGVELLQSCLSQIVPVADYLSKKQKEVGYKIITDEICPFLKNLVLHPEADIRALSRKRLGDIAPLLTEKDRDYLILPMCLNLVHDDKEDANKVAGLKLLGQLTPLFTKEFVGGYITSELISLSQDRNMNVRSESIIQMAKIGSHIDQQIIQTRFLPEFKRLSKDKSWQVRRAFVDNSVALASFLTVDRRGRDFCYLFANLLNDKNRWVKEATLKQLGHVLSLLNAQHMNEKLFNQFLKIPSLINKMPLPSKLDINLSCAKTLPKVIKAYGKASWQSLRSLYKLLLQQDDEIKAELAKTLHLLAKSVDKKVAQTELLLVMNSFITSTSYLVKQEAIKNLAVFLQTIDKRKRETMADVYAGLQADIHKWRIRDIIAGQINILCTLFSDHSFNMVILPLIFSLCKDNVAKVREKACTQIHHVVRHKMKSEGFFMILEQIKSFADFGRFTWRQGFLYMCDGLLRMPEFFKENLLDRFLTVTQDPVINVRIIAAKVLAKHIKEGTEILKLKEIQEVIQSLHNDDSFDVRRLIFPGSKKNDDIGSPKKGPVASKTPPTKIAEPKEEMVEGGEEVKEVKEVVKEEEVKKPEVTEDLSEVIDTEEENLLGDTEEDEVVPKSEEEVVIKKPEPTPVEDPTEVLDTEEENLLGDTEEDEVVVIEEVETVDDEASIPVEDDKSTENQEETPKTVEPETDQTITVVSETVQPETVEPETIEPEIVETKIVEAETVKTETVVEPEIVEPETAEPVETEITEPETVEQEIVPPETVETETAEPEIVQPETVEPETPIVETTEEVVKKEEEPEVTEEISENTEIKEDPTPEPELKEEEVNPFTEPEEKTEEVETPEPVPENVEEPAEE